MSADVQAVLEGAAQWALIEADCLDVLRSLPDACIDAVVTDPPAGIEFMGKAWDKFVEREANPSGPQTEAWHDNGGKNPYARSSTPRYQGKTKESLLPFQGFIAESFSEVLRVLKPGGHGLVWALPRTSHHTAMGLERAGFEIRDRISHLFGSGFPKSLDVSKAIDKAAGSIGQSVGEIKSTLRNGFERTGMTLAELNERCGFEASGYLRTSSTWTTVLPPFEKWTIVRDVLGLPSDLDALFRKAERELIGYSNSGLHRGSGASVAFGVGTDRSDVPITAPATPEAIQWSGWGTALKPAVEDWWLVRKPLSGTVAANVLQHGTGALNIDGCRVGWPDGKVPEIGTPGWGGPQKKLTACPQAEGATVERTPPSPSGRWPAHLVLSHTPECRCVGTKRVKAITGTAAGKMAGKNTDVYGDFAGSDRAHGPTGYADADGRETVEAWECSSDCPVRLLDDQSGDTGAFDPVRGTEPSKPALNVYGEYGHHVGAFYGDTGGASRFFYTAKPSRSERDAGLAHLAPKTGGTATARKDGSAGLQSPRAGAGRNGGARNIHPTVKPLELMQWLCRLITPPGGIVLDPFAGSGTTLVAALREGFRVIGVEREPEYVTIARARVEEDAPLFQRRRME